MAKSNATVRSDVGQFGRAGQGIQTGAILLSGGLPTSLVASNSKHTWNKAQVLTVLVVYIVEQLFLVVWNIHPNYELVRDCSASAAVTRRERTQPAWAVLAPLRICRKAGQ